MTAYPHAPSPGKTDTSAAAAPSVRKASDTHTLIQRRLELKGPMTADEIATDLGQSILAIRPRVTECNKLGLIQATDERRANASGHKAIVWKLNTEEAA